MLSVSEIAAALFGEESALLQAPPAVNQLPKGSTKESGAKYVVVGGRSRLSSPSPGLAGSVSSHSLTMSSATASAASSSASIASMDSNSPVLAFPSVGGSTPNPNPSDSNWTATNPFMAKIVYAKWLTDNAAQESAAVAAATPVPTICRGNVTPWVDTRRVIHMEISTDCSGIRYQPGDSVGICAPNPPELVNFLFSVLRRRREHDVAVERRKAGENAWVPAEEPLSLETMLLHPESGEQLTLQECLTYRVDLTSVSFKKQCLMALSKECVCSGDPAEVTAERKAEVDAQSVALKWLASKAPEGKAMYKHFVEAQNLGIVELLACFPDCLPSLSLLLTHLSPNPPRYYSIASSPLENPDIVTVAFSVVRYACVVRVPPYGSANSPASTDSTAALSVINRRGLCTTYLESILSRFLSPDAKAKPRPGPPPPLRLLHKANTNFHLPGSVGYPLILIGPGTGVAPFLGFLDHRAHLERGRKAIGKEMVEGCWRGDYQFEMEDLPPEPCCNSVEQFVADREPEGISLFFGCRGPADYLYKDSLERHRRDNTLTLLEAAFSRTTAEKVYVTHRLKERSLEIADLILNKNAHVYICGDGNHMAKDVERMLKSCLLEYSEHVLAMYTNMLENESPRSEPPASFAPDLLCPLPVPVAGGLRGGGGDPSVGPSSLSNSAGSSLSKSPALGRLSTSPHSQPSPVTVGLAIRRNTSSSSLMIPAVAAVTVNGNCSSPQEESVASTLEKMSVNYLKTSKDADDYIKELRLRKRYCQDIWS